MTIDADARERIRAAAATVARAVASGRRLRRDDRARPRVVDAVDGAEAAAFSLRTLRGRATSVGEPLSRELTRAAMAVRLNGLCAGGAGAGEAVADGLAALLNAGVHPRVPRSGSVGAADLCMMAHVGLGLIGEGEAEHGGEFVPAAQALAAAGLRRWPSAPRTGWRSARARPCRSGRRPSRWWTPRRGCEATQVAAALSMEGFRANLTPLDPRVVDARPAPGQRWAAAGLRALLAGGALTEPGAARRLQDPLSFRCASQVNGSLRFALELLAPALEPELTGAADNPLVLADDDAILSNGNFHVPALALALDAAAIAIAQVASTVTERQARLQVSRLSGLPQNLGGTDSSHASHSGMAPLTKTAQALTLEIRHRAAPAVGALRRSAPTGSRTTPPGLPRAPCGSANSLSACGCSSPSSWWWPRRPSTPRLSIASASAPRWPIGACARPWPSLTTTARSAPTSSGWRRRRWGADRELLRRVDAALAADRRRGVGG